MESNGNMPKNTPQDDRLVTETGQEPWEDSDSRKHWDKPVIHDGIVLGED